MNIIATADKKSLDDLVLAEEVAEKAKIELTRYLKIIRNFRRKKRWKSISFAGILNANSQLQKYKYKSC